MVSSSEVVTRELIRGKHCCNSSLRTRQKHIESCLKLPR
jgi:hypothetical protein